MHVMIDLETLSTRVDAYILEIGAVLFDKEKVHPIFFQRFVSEQPSRHIDPATVLYWLGQEDDARGRIAAGLQSGLPLQIVLGQLGAWLEQPGNEFEHVWCRGASFDLAILRHAYATALQFPSETPWAFRCELDSRTASYYHPYTVNYPILDSDAAEKVLGRKPVKHSALDDAVIEACRIRTTLR